MITLESLARECRDAQRRYFADRTREALIAAKRAEQALDDELARLAAPAIQTPEHCCWCESGRCTHAYGDHPKHACGQHTATYAAWLRSG